MEQLNKYTGILREIEFSIRYDTAEQIWEKLDKSLGLTADQFIYMAVMVHKLEQLNEDVSRIKPQFRRFLKAIYDGRLLPEALVVYQGCNNLLGALAQASPSTQQKLIDVGTVDINTHKGVKTKELDDLTRDELKQIIDPVTGELLPPEKQKLLEVKPREDGPCAVEIRLKLSRVEYDAFLAAAEDKKRSLEGFICETMRNTVGM